MKRHPLDTSDLAMASEVIRLTDEKDRYRGTDADDHVLAGRGNDHLRGGGGADVIRGQAGDDLIRGDHGADVLDGGKGNDSLTGGGGGDSLIGGAGVDLLFGDAGSDTLYGGAGGDYLDMRFVHDNPATPPDGDGDVAIYKDVSDSTPASFDDVRHFVSGEDRVDLSAIDADATTLDSDEAFTFIGTAAFSGAAGELRVDEFSGFGSVLYGDVNGDGVADMKIYVQTNNDPMIQVTDIVL